MAAKDSARGKELELRIGRIFGGRRRRNGEGIGFDDCVDSNGFQLPISIEAKSYSRLQLKTDWLDQARRNSTGRPWILCQRPKGQRRILATLELDTLIDPEFHALIQELTGTGSPTELAWAAGFFDGEGCTTTETKGASSLLRMTAAQTDIRPLERFLDAVREGTINGPYERERRKPIWNWRSTGSGSHRTLKLLWPYLSEPKREQALVVLSTITNHPDPEESINGSNTAAEAARK